MKQKIVIVMPAYNAGKTIESVFRRIPKKTLEKISRIIVVNDGSTDNTETVVKKLMKKYPIKLLVHEINKGYGAAQKTGFSCALQENADVAVLLHSDGQYAPELLPKIIEPISAGRADVVLGSRMLGGQALSGGMPPIRYFGNKFLTSLENLFYGMNISEFHSGYMAYSKGALETIPFNMLSNTFHFDGEMLLMSGKKKLKIAEVPIPTRYAEEKSYLNPLRYGLTVLKIIFKNMTGKYNF